MTIDYGRATLSVYIYFFFKSLEQTKARLPPKHIYGKVYKDLVECVAGRLRHAI